MKKNIYKIIMLTICIMTIASVNVMATNTTSVTTEQHQPRSPKLKTTSVKLKKTTQLQKNQIVSQLIAIKGIKNAYFKGNTVYISYNAKRLTKANAQAYAKSVYNAVVAKKHHQVPQAGRYGNEPLNQPKPQNYQPQHQGNDKPYGGNKPQGNGKSHHNNQQPKQGRK